MLRLLSTTALPDGKGYLFETEDGHTVLAADKLLRDQGELYRKACLSLSSGCPVGCVYCFTQGMPYRPLTSDEICQQADTMLATPLEGTLKISLKQMGEPLLNPQHTLDAVQALHARYHAPVVVSTSGPLRNAWFFERLQALRDSGAAIRLQFSCHTTSDEQRRLLSPRMPMLSLEAVCRTAHAWYNGDKATLNFVPLENHELDAVTLRRLIDPSEVFVKISYLDLNQQTERHGLHGMVSERVEKFVRQLRAMGFEHAYRHREASYVSIPRAWSMSPAALNFIYPTTTHTLAP
jgi:adenine C2-methylase RlmN of 23S rRNA A2503 and tRNA A37